MASRAHASPFAVAPLACAWLWVLYELAVTRRTVHAQHGDAAIAALRPRARRMPAWIAATAWGALASGALVGSAWR